jgi:hypothetical protein
LSGEVAFLGSSRSQKIDSVEYAALVAARSHDRHINVLGWVLRVRDSCLIRTAALEILALLQTLLLTRL